MQLNTKPKKKYDFSNHTIQAASHSQSKFADMSKFVGSSHWPVGKLAGQEPVPIVATTTVATTTLSNPFNANKKKNKKGKKKKFKNARFEDLSFDFDDFDESTSRIVGGKATRANAWSFLVRLERVSATGTIITANWVMTAAHICHGKEHQLTLLEATFGEHDRTKTDKGE